VSRPTHEQFMAACNEVARQRLLKRKIVEVRYMTPESAVRSPGAAPAWCRAGQRHAGVCRPGRRGQRRRALHGVSKSGEEFVLRS